MDRRRNPRVSLLLPVQVWGLDATSLPFTQSAIVTNISSSGAVVHGIRRSVRPGEILDVQLGQEKVRFRVVWTGKAGMRREGEVGLERLPFEPYLLDMDLCRCSQLAAES